MTGPRTETLDTLLSELRAISAAEIERRLEQAYERATDPHGNRTVIFGSGQLGKMVLPWVRRSGIEPLAYCDNNQRNWGASIDGVKILSPADAIAQFGDRAFFLTAIYNASAV